jgi:hypothetical protein
VRLTEAVAPPRPAGRRAAIAAGAAVVATGVAAEVVARAPVVAPALDWSVGAAFVVAAVRATPADRRAARLGLLCAAAWYLATATSATAAAPALRTLAALTVLAYRGPLLHWLVRHAHVVIGRPTAVLLGVGYAACLTGTVVGAAATAAVAVALAVVLMVTTRRGEVPADLRRSRASTARMLVALGGVWGSSLLAPALSTAITTVGLLAVAWHLSRPATSGLRGAVGDLVLDLGPARRPTSPVAASLARALADPDLLIRTYQPDTGWTDDRGRPRPGERAG